MENASKALIIAGAILLSILIIALGVFVFNQAKSAVGNTGLSDQEVAAFNSKFDSYEGNQKGSSVKALINTVRNYNKSAESGEIINILPGTAPTTPTDQQADDSGINYSPTITSSDMYKITFAYNKQGRISAIYYNKN